MEKIEREKFQKKCYEAYCLDWMISHGVSLNSIMDVVAENIKESDESLSSEKLLSDFEEQGFNGSIYACYDEFMDSEFWDREYMPKLLSNMGPEAQKQWQEITGLWIPEKSLDVFTTAGILKAYKSTDPGQPGISVMLIPAGCEYEIDCSFVSVYEDPEYSTGDGERPVDVVIMSYGDANSEEYTVKEIIRREDILAGLEEEEEELNLATPEMLASYIENGGDLYNENTGIYCFLYNDKGSIAYYRLSKEEAQTLARQTEEAGEETWSALLGPGGYIIDDPITKAGFYRDNCGDGWVKADRSFIDYFEEV